MSALLPPSEPPPERPDPSEPEPPSALPYPRTRRDFALFRRGADPRFPPLSVETYTRLVSRALVYHRDRGLGDATVLWVPLAHVEALETALARDGYALDLLATDHNAAGGVSLAYVHVARAGGGRGGMHQPMPA